MCVLASQGGFTGGNSGGQSTGNGNHSYLGGQVENYSGGRDNNYEEQARKMGIQTDPIQHIDSNSERNQELKTGYAKKSGFNKAMIDDANDQANNTKKSNERYYDKKH
jgi:hypothetical protein